MRDNAFIGEQPGDIAWQLIDFYYFFYITNKYDDATIIIEFFCFLNYILTRNFLFFRVNYYLNEHFFIKLFVSF